MLVVQWVDLPKLDLKNVIGCFECGVAITALRRQRQERGASPVRIVMVRACNSGQELRLTFHLGAY